MTTVPTAFYRTANVQEQSHTVRKCHAKARLMLDTSYTAQAYERMMQERIDRKVDEKGQCIRCDGMFLVAYVGEQVCQACH